MAYAGDRFVHDADSHVVETAGWLDGFIDPGLRERLPDLGIGKVAPGEEDRIAEYRRRHVDPSYRADDAAQIMLRKNWAATGSFIAQDRPEALDLLGFASQLVFNTFVSSDLVLAEHSGDLDLAVGMARAHNRAMVSFCSVDQRLLAVGYAPLADLDRAAMVASEAIELGCAAVMVASACPPTHSPSHVALDGVWSACQEAGVPVVLHVGGGGALLAPAYFRNGLPPVPDFHGGDGNFRSVDYMSIPYPVMQTLTVLVLDGVLQRFPDLRVGVIEQGASWFPGFGHMLDSSAEAFRKNEIRIQAMEMRPSEYLRRQVRVTPYPHEDTGWIVEQSGDEVCLFSSDYPHVEGGRNPLGRFDRALARSSEEAKQRFYVDNFEDLMGPVLRDRGLTAAQAV
jgi:predicted TIM-barrel fold metal-dependent hydrolase